MKALEDVRVRARALQLSLPTDRLQQVWSELRVGGEAPLRRGLATMNEQRVIARGHT